MAETISFTLNGAAQSVVTDPDRPLLEVLREDLGLTGTRFGCGESQCGACTVIINGRAVTSCTLRIANVDGREVRTIEGLADGDQLHPVQQAFLDEGAFQCGYCTSGMIMAAVAFLERTPEPDEDDIRRRLGHRNMCRCGSYTRIIRAIQSAAAQGGAES